MDAQDPSQNFGSVVIPLVAGVGNALMALPMVRQIRRNRPGARVAVMAQIDAMAEPLRRLPEVDEVFVAGQGVRGILRGIRWIRQRKPDVFLVPFPSNRWQYNLLAAASGAARVIMHSYPLGSLTTLTFLSGASRVEAQRGIHDVIQNLRLLRLMGIEADESDRPELIVNDADRQRAAGLLREAGINGKTPFIAVHAGSARTVLAKAKRWPAENYAELIRSLCAEFDHEIVLLEGPAEVGVADEILRYLNFRRCDDDREAATCDSGAPPVLAVPRTGETPVSRVAPPRMGQTPVSQGEHSRLHVLRVTGPLGDVAAVLEQAELYVGSDSGLAHLAAAVGTPPITLFAPADPDRVAPYGYRDLVVQPPRECSPCFLYPWQATKPKMRCHEPMCINLITVQRVMDAVKKAKERMKSEG